MSDPHNNYEVGYGKPPKDTQFKKGQSGNKRGRSKGQRNFRTDLKDVLNTKVTVKENGKQRKRTTQQATLMRLAQKSLKGDPKSIGLLLDYAERHSEEEEARTAATTLPKIDQSILDRYLERRETKQEVNNPIQDQDSPDKIKPGGNLSVGEAIDGEDASS